MAKTLNNLLGLAGGQTLVGGNAASETLTLSSTSHATKGKILFGTSAYDEVNNRLGIGTSAPDKALEINSATGACLRLTYNDSNGSAASYSDLSIDSAGDLTIAPSGGDTNITGNTYVSNLTKSGLYESKLSGTISVPEDTTTEIFQFDIRRDSAGFGRIRLVYHVSNYVTRSADYFISWRRTNGNPTGTYGVVVYPESDFTGGSGSTSYLNITEGILTASIENNAYVSSSTALASTIRLYFKGTVYGSAGLTNISVVFNADLAHSTVISYPGTSIGGTLTDGTPGLSEFKVQSTADDTMQSAVIIKVATETTNTSLADGFGPAILFRLSAPTGTGVVTPNLGRIGTERNGAYNTADMVFETSTTGTLAEKLRLTAAGRLGIGDAAPGELLDVAGNANVTGVYKVDDVQVVSNRVVDARCDDTVDTTYGAEEAGVLDALRDAMIAHGLIAAA